MMQLVACIRFENFYQLKRKYILKEDAEDVGARGLNAIQDISVMTVLTNPHFVEIVLIRNICNNNNNVYFMGMPPG